jgi:hypothetical protein
MYLNTGDQPIEQWGQATSKALLVTVECRHKLVFHGLWWAPWDGSFFGLCGYGLLAVPSLLRGR